MKRTTKSLIALLVLVAMCVSFCVPTFAVEAESHDEHADEVTCVCAGKDHTLEALGITAEEAEELGYLVKDEVNCITGGWSIYKCINCPDDDPKAYFVGNYVKPGEAGHDFEGNEPVIKTPATCDTDGLKVTKCNRCGDVEEVIPALGHDLDEDKVEYWKGGVKVDSYLCTDGNVVIKTPCTRCDHVHEVEYKGGEHDFVNGKGYKGFEKEATCIESGIYKEICDKCNYTLTVEVFVDKNTDPTVPGVHNWDYANAEVYEEPKCNKDGKLKGATCLDCGYELTEEIVLESKDVPHDFSKKVDYKAPTCFEDGNEEHFVCVNCGTLPLDTEGNPIDVSIPKLEHKNATQLPEDIANSVKGSCYNYGVVEAIPADVEENVFYAMADKVELTEANKGWAMAVYTCPDCNGAKYVKYTAPYEHLDKGVYIQEPTHTLVGLSVELCRACGQNDNTTLKTLPAYTHVVTPEMVLQNKVPAHLVLVEGKGNARDCENDGHYYYQCTACYEGVDCEEGTVTEIEVIIPALGHDFKEEHVDATCSRKGYTWSPCQREGCDAYDLTKGIVEDEGEIPADAPHRFPETNDGYTITTAPSCFYEGQKVKMCLDCNWYDGIENGKMNYVPMEKLEHNMVLDEDSDETYPPMCAGSKNKGNNHYVCTNSWVLADGTEVNCTYTEDVTVALTGHSWEKTDEDGNIIGVLVADVAPTCTTVGYKQYRCTNENCNVSGGALSDTYAKAIPSTIVPALGHSYADLEKNRANADYIIYPACDGTVTRGQYVYVCDRDTCTTSETGHILNVNITDVNDPDYDFDKNNSKHHVNEHIKDASMRESTCEKQGVIYYICEDCKLGNKKNEPVDTYDFGELQPAKTHYDFATPIQDYVAPECEKDGKYEAFKCGSVCGLTYYVNAEGEYVAYTDINDTVIPATGHDLPTTGCIDQSKRVCANDCGYEEDAPAHTEVVLPAVAPTCETPGLTEGKKCTVCDTITVEQIVVDPTEHDVVAGTAVVPTCTTPGYTPVSCSDCEEVLYFVAYLDATGHDMTKEDKTHKDWKEPTCLADGLYVYGCADCDTTERDFVVIDNCVEGNLHKNAAGQTFGATCVAGVTDYNCVNKICVTEENPNGIECTVNDKTGVEHAYLTQTAEDCTIDRYTLEICQRCHDAKVTGFVEAEESHELGAYDENDVFTKDAWEIVTVATLSAKGTKRQVCSRCAYKTEPVEYSANDGVQFNFDITNLKGEQEYVDADAETKVEVYAGRVQLVITATAQNANLSSILLKLKFDNAKLAFVGGKLTTKQFAQTVYTFTDVASANAKGIVNIMVESANNANLPLTSGDFAVLEFEILDKKTPGEITFTYDDTTEIRDEDNGVVTVMPVESMPVAKTRALGKLTEGGEQIGLADFNKIVEVYQSGEYTSDADINMDGDITAADINEIRKNLIGNDSTLD